MPVETQAPWSRGEEKGLHQETTFSPELLQHVHLVLPAPTVCLPHAGHGDPGPCAGIICMFAFPPLQGGSTFPSLRPRAGELGHSWHRRVPRVMGVQEEGPGVNTACGPAHEPNKASRPFAHSLPFLYLSLIKLCKEMS